jgi:hypothetical protein
MHHRARSTRRCGLQIVVLLAMGLGLLPQCYPAYRTQRPEARITVLDDRARPLVGAQVILVSNYHPHRRELARDTSITDSLGVARFSRKRAWEREVLMIHGSREYFWYWCAAATGKATFASSDLYRFDAAQRATLTPGAPTPCPSRETR